ncbi:DUF503 domain-containing protein [bacterium]|nr:MAG: DUF503 domain-containing protein [bacterium]
MVVVGAVKIELYIHGAQGLKEKRSVVKRVLNRLRENFPVSAAEVEDMDLHQKAVIACALVTNDKSHANSVLDKLVDYLVGTGLCEVGRASIELINL